MKILVIEDNQILARNLVRYLSSQDIFTDLALDGEDWYHKALMNYYDIIILDLNLPKIWGIEICKKLREREKEISIIMLTSMGTNDDIVNGLDSGADDYLVKPFEYSELLARINAILRRKMKNQSNTIIKVADIELDLQKMEVKKSGEIIKLSKLEYDLFKYLMQNKGKTLSRSEIYEVVWGEFQNDFVLSKTIEVYIWYLRKKLWKEIIETKKWHWYLIKNYE